MTRRWLLIAAAAALLTGAPKANAAPNTGGLQGVVTGLDNGLVLPQVSITLRSETQPFLEIRHSGRDGAFQFDGVPPGLYSLEASQPGFRSTKLSPILVIPGREVTEHVVLERIPVGDSRRPRRPAQTS